ncbi:MAG: cohesin domain-containing protein [Ruminococcus sp.]|nr:cohesin domain-containing protein [Ruminococcus sp.]
MKKHISRILSVFFVMSIVLASSFTTSAAEDELVINSDAKVKVGDTVKFSLYLSDTTEDIIGFEMRLFYDNEYLEFDKDSITYEKFNGVIHNLNLENKIPISWTNISEPANFSQKALFVSADFKVLKGGETEISQFVTEMYGDDMTYLKSYKWTYDITVNNEPVVTDKTPVMNADEETLNRSQGSFINYVDGMGEENSPNQDNHEVFGGTGPQAGTNVVSNVLDVTRYENAGGSGSSDMTPIIIVAAIVVVIGAIIAILIVKKKDDKKNATNTNFEGE